MLKTLSGMVYFVLIGATVLSEPSGPGGAGRYPVRLWETALKGAVSRFLVRFSTKSFENRGFPGVSPGTSCRPSTGDIMRLR